MQEITNSYTSGIDPRLPSWAQGMVSELLVLEIDAGTIPRPSESKDQDRWSTQNMEALMRAAEQADQKKIQDLSHRTEVLFARIAQGLTNENWTPEQIAGSVNLSIPTGCRLPYCSEEEVLAALKN